jgi:hypothetical protein
LKGGPTLHANTHNGSRTTFKNNRPIVIITVVVFASLFFCSLLLKDIGSAYGSRRGGGIIGGGGGGEARLTVRGDFHGREAITLNIPNVPDVNPNSPIISGHTRDNVDHGPVGPHGPYGPGPAGPRHFFLSIIF